MASSRTDGGQALLHRALPAVLLVLLGIVCLRCAWMSDDAYVTLRTVDNWIRGHGLRFNPAERVQGFTHPLWMLVLAGPYAITREGWLTPMLVGWAFTLGAAGVLALRVARGPLGAAVALAVLLGSKAAVDYTTSGLENPLENLLLVLFVAELFGRGRLVVLVLLTALLATTRLDAPALVAPALLVAAAGRRPREWAVALVGLLPLVLWHGFALLYYGALLPNTAYAKLGAGIPVGELAARSWWAFAWTARVDPLTLPAIGAGVAAASYTVVRSAADPKDRAVGSGGSVARPAPRLVASDLLPLALAAGIGLHLLWVVRIGGDFMGGRFFVAPLWVAATLLARAPWTPRAATIAVAGTLLALLSPHAPLRSGPGYVKAEPLHGVVDERGYYWRGTGLWGGSTVASGPRHEFARDGRAARGRKVAVKSVIGLFGYEAGPGLHVIDRLALTDPLLARLPAEYDPDWRIGHFRRRLPDGYVESVTSGENRVTDPQVHALYGAVRLATRAPLLAPGRLGAILALQRGLPIDEVAARYPDLRWTAPGADPVEVGPGGLGVRTSGSRGIATVTLFPPAGRGAAGAPKGPPDSGRWTLLVERGSRRVRRLDGPGPFVVELDGADRLVLFPASAECAGGRAAVTVP